MMHNEYYGLTKNPFSKNIQSSSLFEADCQQEALLRLMYVAEHQQFAVMTGDCGTGKTTILRKYKDLLDDKKYQFLYLADSKLTPKHFYNGLLCQLGRERCFFRGDSRRTLHQEIQLVRSIRQRSLVVVVDEAHLLDRDMLEEIRFLLNFKMDSVSPLALVLSGQTELEENLVKKTSAAIWQRVDFRCRMSPLTLPETIAYVAHQLEYAGKQTPVFTETALKEIFAYSAGVPRLINRLCLSCLIYGSITKKELIEADIVKGVIESEFK
jgi:type II secretory pathway predicted ATPase ExeA